MKSLIPTEHDECVVVADYLDLKRIVYLHVPNELARVKGKGIKGWQFALYKKLKDEGFKPGAPDYLCFTPVNMLNWPRLLRLEREEFRGRLQLPTSNGLTPPCLAIEMKRKNMVPSDLKKNQIKWLHDLQQQGWVTFVSKGANEALQLLEVLYGIRDPSRSVSP